MTDTHPYGPHQPEAAPNAVTVLSPAIHTCGRATGHDPECTVTRYPMPESRPIPPVLVRQRERINELAHQRAAGLGTVHHCQGAAREVWLPADDTRDGGAWCPLCYTLVVAS